MCATILGGLLYCSPGVAFGAVTDNWQRIAGQDRIETAVKVFTSNSGWGDTALIARSDSFPDAIAATPLAAALKAPVLLTKPGELDARVKEALKAKSISKAIILGGPGAISYGVESALKDSGITVQRVAGASRYETAQALHSKTLELNAQAGPVFLATGQNYPDALVAGVIAAKANGTVLLTNGDSLSPEVKALAEKASQLVAVGGQAVNAVKNAGLKAANFSGDSRYSTAAGLLAHYYPGATGAFVVAGDNFPDALAAGALAALKNKPLVLASRQGLPRPSGEYIGSIASKLNEVPVIVGGPGAVSDEAAETGKKMIAHKLNPKAVKNPYELEGIKQIDLRNASYKMSRSDSWVSLKNGVFVGKTNPFSVSSYQLVDVKYVDFNQDEYLDAIVKLQLKEDYRDTEETVYYLVRWIPEQMRAEQVFGSFFDDVYDGVSTSMTFNNGIFSVKEASNDEYRGASFERVGNCRVEKIKYLTCDYGITPFPYEINPNGEDMTDLILPVALRIAPFDNAPLIAEPAQSVKRVVGSFVGDFDLGMVGSYDAVYYTTSSNPGPYDWKTAWANLDTANFRQ